MKSTITKSTFDSNEANAFIPMDESQMASKKGGVDEWYSEEFQQWVLEWIDDQAQDPDSIVTQILSNFTELTSIDESDWNLIGDNMDAEGLSWPSATELEESIFLGGPGAP